MQKALTLEKLLAEVLQTVGHVDGDDAAGSPTPKTPLRDIGFDSLAALELGIGLEENYGISINAGAFSLQPHTNTIDLWTFINK